jgi:hypothetical protein
MAYNVINLKCYADRDEIIIYRSKRLFGGNAIFQAFQFAII